MRDRSEEAIETQTYFEGGGPNKGIKHSLYGDSESVARLAPTHPETTLGFRNSAVMKRAARLPALVRLVPAPLRLGSSAQ